MNSSDLSSPSRILELFSPAAEGNKEPKTLSQLVRLIRGFGVPADGVFINTYFRQEGIIRFFARATADEEITAPLDRPLSKKSRSYLDDHTRAQTLIVDRIEDDPVTEAAAGTVIPGIRSFIMQKLTYDGHHIGVIGFWSKKNSAFTKNNARLIASLVKPLSEWASKKYLQSLKEENDLLRSQLQNRNHSALTKILETSPGLRSVGEQILKVAGTDVTVLISGESGVGKEVIAKTIVSMSNRQGSPFVVVNCGAIPSSLIESELFGYEKGAFTGASARRAGFFEQANGGTLFLDEIGELPLFAQVKLLRALQQKSFHRIGGEHPLKVNVRIIAATNRDLSAEVSEGRFREDLFYRLNVFPITVPPLRERPADILSLATLFTRRFAAKYGYDGVPLIEKHAKNEAVQYAWPGNVRELENASERAVLLDGLTIHHLIPEINRVHNSTDIGEEDKALNSRKTSSGESLMEENQTIQKYFQSINFQDLEKAYFSALLEKTAGRISGPRGAANLAGLNANTFRSKLLKLGLL